MELNDGVAVITGAAAGIGLGLARACVDRGMGVVIADLDAARVEEAAAQLRADGATATAHGCDVRHPAQVEALRDAALADMGRIDLVCNNAGVGLARPVTECSEADWNLLFDVNVNGVINGIRTFLPHLIAQGTGHISATASLSGLVGDPDLVVYNGTKFAVVGMMEALALELRRDHPGVGASVLCPGPVATDLMATSDKARADAGSTHETDQEVIDYLARGASPDEVGRMAVEGMATGQFWLLSHPELTFDLLDPRYEAMRERQLYQPGTWTSQ